jgi:hypothetical protein
VSSRREKFPFALLWLRFSAQAAAGSLAVLLTAALLFSRVEDEVYKRHLHRIHPFSCQMGVPLGRGFLCEPD